MVRTGLLTRTRQITEYSCGASALQAVLHYWGKDVDEQELMRIMGTNPEVGTFPENIARGARESGFEVEVRTDLTLDEVARFTAEVGPMIALCQVWRSDRARSRPEDDWDNGHYITVLGVDADFVYFQDPYLRMGKIFVTRRHFERHWHQIMGGAQSGNPALMHLGIMVRGTQPAPTRTIPALDPAALDFTRLGSFNMMVTHFDHVLLPFEFMDELRDLAADRSVRVEAFILVSKSAEGDISAMEGGNLEEERDAAEISVLLGVLAARAIGSAQSARRTAEHTLEAVGAGDFGLSAEALRALAAKLEPGHSAVITLFENVWERRFREVARKYGGEVREQRLVSSATVAAAARELL